MPHLRLNWLEAKTNFKMDVEIKTPNGRIKNNNEYFVGRCKVCNKMRVKFVTQCRSATNYICLFTFVCGLQKIIMDFEMICYS